MARVRVAAVSFLNAKPLLVGLDEQVDLYLDVPSRLLSGLAAGAFDVALLPVADIARLPGAHIVADPGRHKPAADSPHAIDGIGKSQGPAAGGGSQIGGSTSGVITTDRFLGGGIGCDGETLTVRIYSDRPLQEIHTLLCDTDSHTSVELARVILRERFGVEVQLQPLPRGQAPAGPCLLIGDKVITDPPAHLPIHHDLGDEWKRLTGLPFVFAAWTARPGFDPAPVAHILANARALGLSRAADLARTYAPRHGWPVDTAIRYFTQYLRYEVRDRELQAIRLFHLKSGLVTGLPVV